MLILSKLFHKYILYISIISVCCQCSFSLEDMTSSALQYRRVRLKGIFDHSKEIYLMPRTLNTGQDRGAGFGRKPKSGAHIITPFELSDSGSVTLFKCIH